MRKAVIDLRGMETEELMESIGKNLEDLEEGEFIEFIIDREEVVAQLQKSDLKMEIRKTGEDYIIKVSGGKIDIKEKKEMEDFEINENTNVGKLVSRYPEAIEILASYGFTPIRNPILRKTLAKTITLGQAKKLEKLSDEKFEELLKELRKLKKN